MQYQFHVEFSLTAFIYEIKMNLFTLWQSRFRESRVVLIIPLLSLSILTDMAYGLQEVNISLFSFYPSKRVNNYPYSRLYCSPQLTYFLEIKLTPLKKVSPEDTSSKSLHNYM